MSKSNYKEPFMKHTKKDSLVRTAAEVDSTSMFTFTLELELTFVEKSLLSSSHLRVSQVAPV